MYAFVKLIRKSLRHIMW